MVSVKKKNKKIANLEQDTIPLNANPYQLSVTFLHKFLSRFQRDVYNNVRIFYDKLSKAGSLEVALGTDAGSAGTLASLLPLEKLLFKIHVPEQVIVMDPNLFSANENYAKIVEKYKDLVSKTYQAPKLKEVFKQNEPPKKDNKKVKNKDFAKKKPAAVSSNDDEDIVFQETAPEQGQIMAARSGSRLALYMKESAGQDMNLQHTYDYFVVASCEISVGLNEKVEYQSHLDIPNITCRPIVKEELPNALARFIHSKGHFGAKIQELTQEFKGAKELVRDLKLLMENDDILRLGVVETRFVSRKHCQPWLLRSFDLKRYQKEQIDPSQSSSAASDKINWNQVEMIDMKIRPWIKINGSLNKKVLDFFLISVLNYVQANPGARMDRIAQHFQPALQPMHTRELLEFLAILNAVKLRRLDLGKKCSLFSQPEALSEVDEVADILDEQDHIFVEPHCDALLKVAMATNHVTKIFECPCHF